MSIEHTKPDLEPKVHVNYKCVDFVVDSGTKDCIQKLDRLQEKAIRHIEYTFDKYSRKEIDVLQKEFNIDSLPSRRKRNLVKIVHKTSKDEVNIDISRPPRDLRSKMKVKLKNKFTLITKVYNSPLYRGIRQWDQLPPNLQFKTGLNRLEWK